MKTLSLVATDTTTTKPKSISVFNHAEFLVAKVYIDGETEFSKMPIQINDLKQIVTIAENFMLFWNNLYN